MLLRQLEYYCAVCRNASFTKAADELFVSQSAISQQVKALEADLDVQLIERKGRSLSLTPAGELFYRRGAELLEAVENLRYETEGIAKGLATRLTVGYLNSWRVGSSESR